MSSPNKLHPISYLNGLITAIKQNFIVFIVFIFFQLKDFDFSNPQSYIWPGFLFAIFVVTYSNQIIKAYTTRYWIENDKFILTKGLFNKERKELNIERIQSVDTAQTLINQLIGGVELKIKTPSDGIELSVITKKQSEFIEHQIDMLQLKLLNDENEDVDQLNHDKINSRENSAQETIVPDSDDSLLQQRIYHMPFKQLVYMAMTSGAIGLAFATIGPTFGVFSEYIPWSKLGKTFGDIAHVLTITIIAIIVCIIVISYIVGTILNIIRYYDFCVTYDAKQLKITYGFFNKKKITVPTERVQAIVEQQSYLRRLFGYTAIHFLITSDFTSNNANDDGNKNGNVIVLPFIKRKSVYQVLQKLVPEMNFQQIEPGMPRQGFHRHFLIPTIVIIAVTACCIYFWVQLLWLIVTLAAVMILLFIVKAIIYTKNAGFKITNDELTIRTITLFNRRTYYLKRNKIIGLDTFQHPLLKRSHLINFKVVIAKGFDKKNIGLKYAKEQQVLMLKNWFERGGSHERD